MKLTCAIASLIGFAVGSAYAGPLFHAPAEGTPTTSWIQVLDSRDLEPIDTGVSVTVEPESIPVSFQYPTGSVGVSASGEWRCLFSISSPGFETATLLLESKGTAPAAVVLNYVGPTREELTSLKTFLEMPAKERFEKRGGDNRPLMLGVESPLPECRVIGGSFVSVPGEAVLTDPAHEPLASRAREYVREYNRLILTEAEICTPVDGDPDAENATE